MLTTADPLSYEVPLPLSTLLYPMGFPVRITTNSKEVIAAANTLWACYPRSFCGRRVELRVAVAEAATVPPAPSMPRGQQHLISIVHSAENFASADLARGFAFAWLTVDVAADHAYTRHYFLEPLVYLLLDALHLTPVHAAAVALNQNAVLLCGESGAGKTSLAYACARRGWSYLADDITHLIRRRPDYTVVGRPYQIRFRAASRDLFPELRRFPAHRRLNGKLDLETDPAQLGLSTQLSAQASYIVFLDRRTPSTGATLEPFSPEEALPILEQVICFGSSSSRRQHSDCLRHLLTLPVLRLTYADFDSAEAVLRGLLAAGH
ncbi:MAG: hypothetical protein NTY38_24895 [Acidobacteria bacterium]|nr:hypothetical protein [Acidobacteriota bacterium]